MQNTFSLNLVPFTYFYLQLQRGSKEVLPNYCDKLGMVPPNDVKLRNALVSFVLYA